MSPYPCRITELHVAREPVGIVLVIERTDVEARLELFVDREGIKQLISRLVQCQEWMV